MSHDWHLNCYHHCFLATSIIWWFVTDYLLFSVEVFESSAESGNSSVREVVKYLPTHSHFLTKAKELPQPAILSLLIVPYQASSPILLLFSSFVFVCLSGVGRTVWRVRVQQPLFLMSWSEHDSWRASIWNSTKSQAHCCPSACGTAPFSF